MIVYMQDNGIAAVCSLASSVPLGVAFIETDTAPPDKMFRNAWVIKNGALVEDLDKSKVVAHDLRRSNREKLFRPYDEIIAKQVPGSDAAQAEKERKKIRDADDVNQIAMDAATTTTELKSLLP